VAACGGKEKCVAQTGDTVTVHYTLKLDGGEVFDSSRDRDPLEFIVGSGQVIWGFDRAVRGMAVGESRQVRLEPEEAYGERRDDLILSVPAADVPKGLGEGDRVQLVDKGVTATVMRVTYETVTVDANHPLAGEALTFDIELVSITGNGQ
jgi:FKBP-type peptidyl-prolyl cis-trans isomerase 2